MAGLESKGVTKRHIDVVKNRYQADVTTIRSRIRKTSEFPSTAELHQEYALTPYLLCLVWVN